MCKHVLAMCLLVAAAVALEETFDHELQQYERLMIKFKPSKKFSFEFLTESNEPVFKLTCADGKNIRIVHDDAEPIIKDVGLAPGKELELSFYVGDDGVHITKDSLGLADFNTTGHPLTKIVKIKMSGLEETPVFSAVL
uniref:Secreted protein n=1 Tax=Panagrellus redivivus TaxID=6233 RepID=A0A7E4W5Q1_PANRE